MMQWWVKRAPSACVVVGVSYPCELTLQGVVLCHLAPQCIRYSHIETDYSCCEARLLQILKRVAGRSSVP